MKNYRGGEGAKKEDDTGNKVPRPPTPLALIPCFQVAPTLTPRPWSGRKRKDVGDETGWDALAGSGATRGTRTTKKASRGSLSQVEAPYYHGLTLPSAIAEEISSINIAEASPSAADEDYLSEEDVRAEYLSRFDSSTVSMLNEETLLIIRPDGKKEFFEKKRQMGIKSGTNDHAVYSSRIDTLQN